MSDAGASSNDATSYDPGQPVSILGDVGFNPAWSVGGDTSQPSIVGPALNPPAWTPDQNSLQFFVDPDTMKTIDFAGTDQPRPSQPDGGGFYTSLTPWQSDPSNGAQDNGGVAPQAAMPSLPSGSNSGVNGAPPSSSPAGGTAAVGAYTLPGLGKTYLDPQFAVKVGALILKAQDQNIPLGFTSGYRDSAKQAALESDPNAITPARNSLHSAGLAVDVHSKDVSPELLSAAADAGLNWGGDYRKPDVVHFYSDPGTDRTRLIDNFSRGIAALRSQIPDN